MTTISPPLGVGGLLRDWRQRRRLSQLDLSNEAEVSARHLSFVETGRAKPSRELVLHLAEHLDVPLRERNSLLMAAGFAPVFRERSLDDADMDPVRGALDMILAGHQPYPSVIVDRLWNLVSANDAALALFTAGVAPALLEPPINVVRLGVHPDGLGPKVHNLAEFSGHLLLRLQRQLAVAPDPELAELYEEVLTYPGVVHESAIVTDPTTLLFVPMRFEGPDGQELALFSTLATFGTALDITLAELSIESFFPADAATEAFFPVLTAATEHAGAIGCSKAGMTELTDQQAELCESNSTDFSDLTAVFLSCTLKRSPEVSNTEGLAEISMEIMRRNGVGVELIRAIDQDIATGVYPDMTEHGWATDAWPSIFEKVMAADILVLLTPIWLGEKSSVCTQVIERLYGNSSQLNEAGQYAYYGRVGGCLVTGNEDGIKHCAMNILYSLQHLGYVIPPQADAGWIGEAGPGPSYLDPDEGGRDNDFTNRNTTFMTWNLLHVARMLKDNGGMPAHGNQRAGWDAGCRYDFENPEHR